MTNKVEQNLFSKEKLRRAKPALAAIVGGLALAGCNSVEAMDYGDKNTDITTVTIEDGARFRDEPFVAKDPNARGQLLHEVEMTDSDKYPTAPNSFSVEVDGIYEHSNDNDWIGIDAEELASAVPDIDPEADEDGIVWISRQRASANERSLDAAED